MNEIKKVLSTVQKALLSLVRFISSCFVNVWNWQQQQQQYQQQLIRTQKIINQQNEIQCELAQVFQHSHYTNLVQINSVTDLRQNGYKDNGTYVIYYFTIDKTVWQRFPLVIGNSIRQAMNQDIFSFQRFLASNYPVNDIMMIYPALYCGVNIIGLQDQNISVRLAVITKMPL